MVEKGIQNCLLPYEKMFSKGVMSDILSGKRALIFNLSELKSYLSIQVKQKGHCGFYLAESAINHIPQFMLYNKKLNKKLKDKIDFMYENFSYSNGILNHFFAIQTFRNIRAKTISLEDKEILCKI